MLIVPSVPAEAAMYDQLATRLQLHNALLEFVWVWIERVWFGCCVWRHMGQWACGAIGSKFPRTRRCDAVFGSNAAKNENYYTEIRIYAIRTNAFNLAATG